MKKFLYPLIVLLLSVIAFSFTPAAPGQPKMYPAIEKYFSSVSNVSIPEKHNLAIKHLESVITSSLGDKDVSIMFTCPDNSFRSQAAQILLQSLITANGIKRVNVVSAGNTTGQIDPRLIKLLTAAGYKVVSLPTIAANAPSGSTGYSVSFGDKFTPLVVYAKSATDAGVEKAGFYLFKTCDQQENGCSDLTGALHKDQLEYSNPATITEDKALQEEFNTIAKEMSYIVTECLK
ncbi:hypothetical protein [Chitinophaga defluvii]|uniref:Phosphotyrosine protein phosphatase I domain-containing protein n=1 Tax=Chitinophaga defluvii TaxID=3163343 RepID=A0ABV2T5A3_9BACT